MYECRGRPAVTIMNMSTPRNSSSGSVSSATAWTLGAAVVIVLGLLGAGVALAAAGWKETSIIGLLTAVGTIAATLLAVLPKLVQLNEKVEQVAHQTNGQMRQLISDTIRDEMHRAGLSQPAPTPQRTERP